MSRYKVKMHNEPLDVIHGQISLLVSGLISADITFRVGEMPRRAEKYRAKDVRFSLGGGGAIAAVAMQRLGATVQLAGRLGDDLFGDLLRNDIAKRCIGRDLIACVGGSQSPVSSVFVDDAGDRQIVNYREVGGALAVSNEQGDVQAGNALNNDRLQSMSQPQAVLVDTRWEAAAVQVLGYARQRGIPAVIDGEAPVSAASMGLASHIAFSRQGLRDYAGRDDMEQGLRQAQAAFGCWVGVTDGEKGVYHLFGDEFVLTPAFPIKAVDTLGAGDVWHAAFTLQLAKGSSEADAVHFANAAAALKCASGKGLDGIPTYSEVMDFLA